MTRRSIAGAALALTIAAHIAAASTAEPAPSAGPFVPSVRLAPAEVTDRRPAETPAPTGDIGTAIIGWPDGRTEEVTK